MDRVLFFGCRRRASDCLFGSEWEEMNEKRRSEGLAPVVEIAYSQDQEGKEYVTHKIKQQGERVWRLLKGETCCVIISGSAKRMPADVRKAFLEVIQRYGGLDEKESESFLKRMAKSKRYIVEAWN
jgi:sulfite reductase alpha subunit-like flavoprotein